MQKLLASLIVRALKDRLIPILVPKILDFLKAEAEKTENKRDDRLVSILKASLDEAFQDEKEVVA